MGKFLEAVFAIVTAAGQQERLKQRGAHFTLHVENGGYLPLTIEAWDSPVAGEGRRISVAHYRHIGGDLVADPEVEIRDDGFPIELTQIEWFTPVVAYYDERGAMYFYQNAMRDVRHFLDTVWGPNLVAQGFVRAAQRLAVETVVAA